jgi:hypothetical protein
MIGLFEGFFRFGLDRIRFCVGDMNGVVCFFRGLIFGSCGF